MNKNLYARFNIGECSLEKQTFSKWPVSLPDTDTLQQCEINGSGNVYYTFLFLSLLRFHRARKTTFTVYTIYPISKDNTGQPPDCSASRAFEWQSKEIMFCIPFSGLGEERHWRKSKKRLCRNKDHLSPVFSPLTGKRMSEGCD